MLAQRFKETRPGGKKIEKLHPIAYASKRTSLPKRGISRSCWNSQHSSSVWTNLTTSSGGFPVEIETDCQALRDVMLSDNLNATHARWRDGVLSHQIVDVRHIPGRINLVGDGLSRKDENLPHELDDGSSWSVTPDWETARGLEYDLFSVETTTSTLHSELRDASQRNMSSWKSLTHC